MKRMQHLTHGFAFAMNSNEFATMASNGWVEETDQTDPIEIVEAQESTSEIDEVRAKLDTAGITYDGRLGLAKLRALLPE